MRVEPATSEAGAEGMRVCLLEQHVEHLLSATNAPNQRLFHDATNANWSFHFLGREAVKLGPVLVTAGEMGKKILDGPQPESTKLAQTRSGNPAELGEWRFEVHAKSLNAAPASRKRISRISRSRAGTNSFYEVARKLHYEKNNRAGANAG
jgi:hypothetical protein